MLKMEDVSVRMDGKCIVDSVSLSLLPGQWLMLCGPNGAGKSTLVNAMAQSVPYSGRILLSGRDIRQIRPRDVAQTIGVLSQTNQVEYGFSVEEVVELGRYAHARGFLARPDPDGENRVEAALEATGLLSLRKQNIRTLSGGEMQRAFLAQVFAQDPKVLILDEPANHLDMVYQRQLFSLIGQWLKAPNRAVICVVHDLSLAKKYGTHALIMDRGRCVAQGTTKDVLTRKTLRSVYGMDVVSWMRDMLGQWEDEDEFFASERGNRQP